MLVVKSTRRWRRVYAREEVPVKELVRMSWLDATDWFGYIREANGDWDHLSNFECTPVVGGWDGIQYTSISTAIVIRVNSDGSKYIIGYSRSGQDLELLPGEVIVEQL
jgi:hypothetical protein